METNNYWDREVELTKEQTAIDAFNTIRVFVGCAANHEDLESQAVLEYSIRKSCSLPCVIKWMYLSNNPDSSFYGWRTENWATPFSGFRWAVPQLCNYVGKAIYMDSDFIVLSDLAELWNQTFELGKVVMAKGGMNWRLCCSLWNCARAQQYIPDITVLRNDPDSHRRMHTLFGAKSKLVQPFQGDWNNLDGRDGKPLTEMKALHYTAMQSQPQLEYALPRLQAEGYRHWYDGVTSVHPRNDVRRLFASLLVEATANGYGIERYATQPRLGKPYRKRSFAKRVTV
jgi:hypothetical protein